MIIYKYILALEEEQVVPMPRGSQLLTVQEQGSGIPVLPGKLCLWAVVPDDEKLVNRTIRIFGTGQPIKGVRGKYVATVQLGSYVWHVFDGGEQ